MTTEVLFNEDDYVWGEWGDDLEGYTDYPSCVYQSAYLEDTFYYRVGHKKKLQKLEVGKVYTTKSEGKRVCIAKVNGYGYMVAVIDFDLISGSAAYTWTEGGVSISLNGNYDVDWSVEPYEMSIIE